MVSLQHLSTGHRHGRRSCRPNPRSLYQAAISRTIQCERYPTRVCDLGSSLRPLFCPAVELARLKEQERQQVLAAFELERAVLFNAYEAVQYAEEMETQGETSRTSQGSRVSTLLSLAPSVALRGIITI
eukprot:6076091-Prymnesium_polylepis.1